jgi:hypothetical protein
MRKLTLTASNAHSALREALTLPASDSLLIEHDGQPPLLALDATLARWLVLTAYAQGGLSRAKTMQLLGLDWYGDLLRALAAENIARPSLPAAQRAPMVASAVALLGTP